MVEIEILGEPMGKQRPKFSSVGRFVKTYTPKETINYESKVVFEYKNKYNGLHFEAHDQIIAVIEAYFQIPKGHYKFYKRENITKLDKQGQDMLNGNIRPTKKPDTDNIAKICLDSLNGIAYPDDSQIVELRVYKIYAEQPKVVIKLGKVCEI